MELPTSYLLSHLEFSVPFSLRDLMEKVIMLMFLFLHEDMGEGSLAEAPSLTGGNGRLYLPLDHVPKLRPNHQKNQGGKGGGEEQTKVQ